MEEKGSRRRSSTFDGVRVPRGRSRTDVRSDDSSQAQARAQTPSRWRVRTRSRDTSLEGVAAAPGIDLSHLANEFAKTTIDKEYDDEDADMEEVIVSDQHQRDTERVTIVCSCEEFDKILLPKLLSDRLSKVCKWRYGMQTIHVPFTQDLLLPPASPSKAAGQKFGEIGPLFSPDLREPVLRKEPLGVEEDIFERCLIFFTYGVVVMWGLTPDEEQAVLNQIVHQVMVRPMVKELVEKERLSVHYCNNDMASIADDIVFLPRRLRSHVGTRLAVSHAAAQSTKLSVFENQGLDLLQSTAHLPRELAQKGKFSLSRTALAKMIGRLFVHKSEVNLLSSVLDTPEYFWSAPDSLQDLFKSVGKYLEIDDRVEAIQTRQQVIQEMFDMLQRRHDSRHGAVLEWIVIWLVAMEFLVGILEFCGTIGLISPMQSD